MKKLLAILPLLLSFTIGKGQQIYFSQFEQAPMFINPGLTGLFDGEFRISGIYKGNFRSVANPYVSAGAALDADFANNDNPLFEEYGVGLMIMNDHSGESLNLNRIMLSGAYHKSLDAKGYWNVAGGIRAGITTVTIDASQYTFPDQWNPELEYYDPTYSNGENLNASNLYPEVSVGFLGYYSDDGMNKNIAKATDLRVIEPTYILGISIDQLNPTNQSFTDMSRSKDVALPRKYTLYGQAKFSITEKVNIHGFTQYIYRGDSRELAVGGDVEYYLMSPYERKKSVFAGVRTRVFNSAVLIVGGEYRSFRMGVSYDLNISPLRVASNYRGGFEISLSYITNNRIGALFCPKMSSF